MGPVSAWQSSDSRPALRAAAPAAQARPSLEGIRVLAVDDDDDARELLRALLESRHAEVVVASSAREAFSLLGEAHPDVVVSDIAMPDEDGYGLIRRIRGLTEEEGGRTPAIAVTAYTGAADRSRAMTAGFNHHVPKPVDVNHLVETILDLAERHDDDEPAPADDDDDAEAMPASSSRSC